MSLGLRGKLFLGVLLAVLAVGAASGLYLEGRLRAWYERRIETELARRAGAARDAVEISGAPATIAGLDPIADRLGRSLGSRVTLIDSRGRVLGDSSLDPAEIARVENHAARPEVRPAIAGRRGLSKRYSTTVGFEMLYLAVPYSGDGGRGVVRVAVPLVEVDRAMARLRWLLAGAALLGLGVAVLASALASQLALRPLRRLVAKARAAVQGEGARRIEVRGAGEVDRLAGSFNQLAGEIGRAFGDLAGERDRLERILEGLGEAVIAVDGDRRVTLFNRAALELLGVEDFAPGRPVLDAVRVPAIPELLEAMGRGETVAVEFDLPGERPRTVHARAAPLRTAEGGVIVMHDVTEMRRLETVRRDFVANVSHELRTPVSVILANAHTLWDGALGHPEHAREFLSGIVRNAERLSHIVADLLDLSRIEAGRYGLELRPVAVEPVARRVLAMVEESARSKGMVLESGFDAAARVVADERALEHVLLNLVDNAVKYTPAGGRVEMGAAACPGGRLRLEVRDDGPGVDPPQRERVFERFYRLDPGRSREMGGTGLGLSIVRHLSEAMGGRAGVEGNVPRGSVFWVELPAA